MERRGEEAKPRLGLDVDGVLALLHQSIVDEWNRAKGTHYTVEDIDEWNLWDATIDMPKEKFFEMYHSLWNDKWKEIKPSVTDEELIKLLEHYDVDLVTHRGNGTVKSLESWLKLYYPNIKFNIVAVDSPEEKLKLPYDIYVDDGNPLADAMAHVRDKHKLLFLIESPWNRGKGYEQKNNIIISKSLGDAIDMLIYYSEHVLSKHGPRSHHERPTNHIPTVVKKVA